MLKISSLETPPTVSSYVLNKIRENILTGRYPAGSKLDQKALTTEFGVSLIPVREALRRLEAEGFIQILPHRGAFVSELSISDLEEIYLIREKLEGLATELAVPNLSKETLTQLAEHIDAMEAATEEQDFAKLLTLNRTFHFLIYDASERPLLLQMISGLWDRSARYRYMVTYLPERQLEALGEHKEIYDACSRGETERAVRVVRNNVWKTVEGIVAKLKADGLLEARVREGEL
jgi:DNA-binding GntR family transcriptional regulator